MLSKLQFIVSISTAMEELRPLAERKGRAVRVLSREKCGIVISGSQTDG